MIVSVPETSTSWSKDGLKTEALDKLKELAVTELKRRRK
jgi:hypothetical protein